jgi:cytochrome P450
MATQLVTPPPHVDPSTMRHCELFDRKLTYDNPHEVIIPRIHEGPAVFFADNIMFKQPGWVVRRNADLKTIFADSEHFSKNGSSGFSKLIGEDWVVMPTELDKPHHTAFRSAVNPLFSPSKMMGWQDKVSQRATELIDQFKDKGECEFIRDFAIPFPISIFLDLIGLPQDRLWQFYDWEQKLLHTTQNDDRIASTRAIKALLVETIADRKKNPGDDMISQVLTIEIDGRKPTDEEIFGFCFNLYIGGLDTVTSNIGLHFNHLANHPEHQRQMRENTAEQNVVAIEELFRAYGATSTLRFCIKEAEVGGCRIMPGDAVIMSTPLAGRDPEAWEAPQEVRLDRRPIHLTLGGGFRRCLGQHLVRRELQTSIEQFLRAIPEFRIEPGYKVGFFLSNVLHIPELPLTWR